MKNFFFQKAVKLGTITSDGKADVYSYPEDDMVKDPFLQQHLEHFGINMKLLKKTEQSMVEMEIEMNQVRQKSLIELKLIDTSGFPYVALNIFYSMIIECFLK